MSFQQVEFLTRLKRDLSGTENRFSELHREELQTWPIPYFGRLAEAHVLTVGVNPSCGEFENDRWQAVTTTRQVVERMTNYFDTSQPERHPWFETWEKALAKIDASYRRGERRHLGLSDWAG